MGLPKRPISAGGLAAKHAEGGVADVFAAAPPQLTGETLSWSAIRGHPRFFHETILQFIAKAVRKGAYADY